MTLKVSIVKIQIPLHIYLKFKKFSFRLKRKRGDIRLHLKKSQGVWQGEKIGVRLTRDENGSWQAASEEEMCPLKDVPEFDESFRRLIPPATRKSRRERKNIPDDEPTPPPTSSSDEDFFEMKKKKRRIMKKGRV